MLKNGALTSWLQIIAFIAAVLAGYYQIREEVLINREATRAELAILKVELKQIEIRIDRIEKRVFSDGTINR